MPNYKPNTGQLKIRERLTNDEIIRLLAISGARAGKTFEFMRSLILRAAIAPGSRHAAIRKHFSEAKKFLWMDTAPAVFSLCFPELRQVVRQNKTDYYFKFPNEAEIWFGGLDDKERADKILGGEYNTIYFNECSEISWSSIVTATTRLAKKSHKEITNEKKEVIEKVPMVNKAYFDANPPHKSHWSYKLFVEHIDPETNIPIDNLSNYDLVKIRSEDNVENLAEGYIDTHLKTLTGDKRKRFYDGDFQEEIVGALWQLEMIRRVKEPPRLRRIVIGVDPSGSKTGDEIGIIGAGIDFMDNIYVLSDKSGHYSPHTWGTITINEYKSLQADAIVVERNFGGDMVKYTIHSVDRSPRVIEVTASRGKEVRAEPVVALYEHGRVFHCPGLVDLENEMFTWVPGEGKSPNRVDGLVWAVTDLLSKRGLTGGRFSIPK